MAEILSTADKTVPKKKRDQSKRRASYQPKFTTHGRPGKRTPQLEKDLLAAIATGAPYRIACQAVSISEDAFTEWRRKDPVFAARVTKAAGQTALRLLKKIEERSEDNFAAAAWILERRFPESFSRPEVQLNIQNNVSANSGNGLGFETIVMNDLAFVQLQKHENYAHRPSEAREVEGEIVVEPSLSGTLVRGDHRGGVVISESQAQENQRRAEKAASKIEKLLAAKQVQTGVVEPAATQTAEGNGNGALTLSPIAMPVGEPPASWWSQLVSGSSEREIEKAAAIAAYQIISREVGMQAMTIDFGSVVLLRDVHAAIQDATGPKGWKALLKKAGQT